MSSHRVRGGPGDRASAKKEGREGGRQEEGARGRGRGRLSLSSLLSSFPLALFRGAAPWHRGAGREPEGEQVWGLAGGRTGRRRGGGQTGRLRAGWRNDGLGA